MTKYEKLKTKDINDYKYMNLCFPPPEVSQKDWIEAILGKFCTDENLPKEAFYYMQRATIAAMICTGAITETEYGLQETKPSEKISVALIYNFICVMNSPKFMARLSEGNINCENFLWKDFAKVALAAKDMTSWKFCKWKAPNDVATLASVALSSFLFSDAGQATGFCYKEANDEYKIFLFNSGRPIGVPLKRFAYDVVEEKMEAAFGKNNVAAESELLKIAKGKKCFDAAYFNSRLVEEKTGRITYFGKIAVDYIKEKRKKAQTGNHTGLVKNNLFDDTQRRGLGRTMVNMHINKEATSNMVRDRIVNKLRMYKKLSSTPKDMQTILQCLHQMEGVVKKIGMDGKAKRPKGNEAGFQECIVAGLVQAVKENDVFYYRLTKNGQIFLDALVQRHTGLGRIKKPKQALADAVKQLLEDVGYVVDYNPGELNKNNAEWTKISDIKAKRDGFEVFVNCEFGDNSCEFYKKEAEKIWKKSPLAVFIAKDDATLAALNKAIDNAFGDDIPIGYTLVVVSIDELKELLTMNAYWFEGLMDEESELDIPVDDLE